MRSRPIATAALVVACGIGLSGCSVLLEGMTGIQVVDGRVVANIRMCDDLTAGGIALRPLSGGSLFDRDPEWSFERTQAPNVDLGSKSEFLKMLGNDMMRLHAAADSLVDEPRVGWSGINALKGGDVLVGTDKWGEPEIVTSQEFDVLVVELCD